MRILTICVSLILVAMSTASAAPCPVSATLTPARPSYAAGEPIELTLVFRNDSAAAVAVPVKYPDLNGRLEFRGLTPAVRSRSPWGGRELLVQIQPNESWQVAIYLERFAVIDRTGPIEAPFRLTVACQNFEPRTVEGTVKFTVVAGRANAARITQQLRQGLDSTDFWPQRTAAEALVLWDAPESLPLVSDMAALGFHDLVAEKLERLKGSPQTEPFVRGLLKSGTRVQRTSALEVATSWRLKLTNEEVTAVAGEADQRLKLKLLHYIESVPSVTYEGVVADLAKDADPTVAASAATVLKKLGRQ